MSQVGLGVLVLENKETSEDSLAQKKVSGEKALRPESDGFGSF